MVHEIALWKLRGKKDWMVKFYLRKWISEPTWYFIDFFKARYYMGFFLSENYYTDYIKKKKGNFKSIIEWLDTNSFNYFDIHNLIHQIKRNNVVTLIAPIKICARWAQVLNRPNWVFFIGSRIYWASNKWSFFFNRYILRVFINFFLNNTNHNFASTLVLTSRFT